MRLTLIIAVVGMTLSSVSFSQAQDQNALSIDVSQIKDAAMKTVDVKIKDVVSSSIRKTMNGSFYQTYIERLNGDSFVIAQVNEHEGAIRGFSLPVGTKPVDEVLYFLKPDFVMIENTEARLLLSSLRMIYNIDTIFPMYVSRFRDRWVLLVDINKESGEFVGFTAKINGKGIIQEVVYSDKITLSEAQRIDAIKLKEQDDE
jgi:hypothetical protein